MASVCGSTKSYPALNTGSYYRPGAYPYQVSRFKVQGSRVNRNRTLSRFVRSFPRLDESARLDAVMIGTGNHFNVFGGLVKLASVERAWICWRNRRFASGTHGRASWMMGSRSSGSLISDCENEKWSVEGWFQWRYKQNLSENYLG